MFREYQNEYNPKIDFKVINLLNPKHDVINNYFEKVKIFKYDFPYTSEQGKWFKKIKNIYTLLLNSSNLTIEAIFYASKELEGNIDYQKANQIINNCPKKFDITHKASWYLYEIWKENVIGKYSYVLAVLVMNSILKNNNYIPMIFTDTYVNFMDKLIREDISFDSFYYIISIYKDMSMKYVDKYDLINKETLLKIVEDNKEYLINKLKIKNLWLFGSFVRDEATEYSDVDLYVEFDEGVVSEEEIKEYLIKIFKRRVDMHVEGRVYERFAPNGSETRELILNGH